MRCSIAWVWAIFFVHAAQPPPRPTPGRGPCPDLCQFSGCKTDFRYAPLAALKAISAAAPITERSGSSRSGPGPDMLFARLREMLQSDQTLRQLVFNEMFAAAAAPNSRN